MRKFLYGGVRLKIFFFDILFVILSYLLASFLVCDMSMFSAPMNTQLAVYGVFFILAYIVSFILLGVHRILWTNASTRNYIFTVFACVVGAALAVAFGLLFKETLSLPTGHSFKLDIVALIIAANLILYSRIFVKMMYDRRKRPDVISGSGRKILIIGAGSAAEFCIRDINKRTNYDIVGIIDDDPGKLGCYLQGIKVIGTRNDIKQFCAELDVQEIIIAMPSAPNDAIADIAEICKDVDAKTKIIPSEGIVNGFYKAKGITHEAREIKIDDLLYREKVELDTNKIGDYVSGRKVIVTGGGGSIGSEICRQLVKFEPAEVVILDHYENSAYELLVEIKDKYPDANISVAIVEIRDKEALEKVFSKVRPEVVFHAAALKHVPLMENYPKEAVKTNIFGTYNVAQMSIKYGIKKFVLISTDKAVNPTNIMGATKRVCEMLVQTLNDKSRTEFVAVRFGNVLGSNGSVIPIFKKQIEAGGPVKVTHKDITRYFMTIPEAASLVLQAGAFAHSGEVFVLDMGSPVKIYELAEKMIKIMGYTPGEDIDIEIMGLRPGEKLYEELYMSSENLKSTRHKRIHIAKPVPIDKTGMYDKLLRLRDEVDTLTDEQVKMCVADITGTYSHTKQKEN